MMRKPTLGLCYIALTVLGCKGQPDPLPAADRPARPAPEVVWAAGAHCGDASVDQFVRKAVEDSVAGRYEEYRLLWSLEHRPTSRKYFEQIRQAIERVTVKAVRPIRFRQADGTLTPQERPTYVFHALVEMSPQAKQRSNNRLDDRHMILLIHRENDGWRLKPPPADIKNAIAQALARADGGEVSWSGAGGPRSSAP